MQAARAKQKRHSRVEVATNLAHATDLAGQGKPQSEIARTLGVSVMTLHRWRKARPEPAGPQPVHMRVSPIGRSGGTIELLNSSSKIHG